MDRITDRLLSWASVLEDRTREQAEQTSRLPFVFPHVALMPDAHLGLGATVGSVIPTERALVPAGRRRRHRLRYGGRAHAADGRRPARPRLAGAAARGRREAPSR